MGAPQRKRGIEAIVTRVRIAAGITDARCSPHTFRHTFSTMYLEQGGAIEKLSRELGHSKAHVTEEYIKSLPLSVARQGHEEFSPVRKLRLTSWRRAAYEDAC
jgi:integrase/recombinase XerD